MPVSCNDWITSHCSHADQWLRGVQDVGVHRWQDLRWNFLIIGATLLEMTFAASTGVPMHVWSVFSCVSSKLRRTSPLPFLSIVPHLCIMALPPNQTWPLHWPLH